MQATDPSTAVATAQSQRLCSQAHKDRAIEISARGRSAAYARAACSTTARNPIVTLHRPLQDAAPERRRARQASNLGSGSLWGNLGDGFLTEGEAAPAPPRGAPHAASRRVRQSAHRGMADQGLDQ